MNEYKVVITNYNNCILFVYLNNGKPIEFQIFGGKNSPLDTVYVGRVEKVVTNIGAAFVSYGTGTVGFLKDCNHRVGDLIPVQLIKDKTKLKEAVLTVDISLSGVYSVLSPGKGDLSISKKLDTEARESLKERFSDYPKKLGYNIILRTNAHSVPFEVIEREIMYLKDKLDGILKYGDTRKLHSILYSPEAEYIGALTDVPISNLDEIVTDDEGIFSLVSDYMGRSYDATTRDRIKLTLYKDEMLPLMNLYSLRARLSEALNRIVWLQSGAFLVIEHTEAFVSIDVNTGKIIKKQSSEDTFMSVNLEACEEIARQLKLRNLSGIILIDFINLKSGENNRLLMEHLRDVLSKDSIRTQVHDMTKLGLVEVTRMKGRQPLYEQARLIADDAKISGNKGAV